MAETLLMLKYNPEEDSEFEGYNNEDIGDNESIAPDSDPDSSDTEVLSVGGSEVSSDHTDFGHKQNDNGPGIVDDATVTGNANIPNWTTNFTDIIIETYTQDSGSSLPENFDVSMATA